MDPAARRGKIFGLGREWMRQDECRQNRLKDAHFNLHLANGVARLCRAERAYEKSSQFVATSPRAT